MCTTSSLLQKVLFVLNIPLLCTTVVLLCSDINIIPGTYSDNSRKVWNTILHHSRIDLSCSCTAVHVLCTRIIRMVLKPSFRAHVFGGVPCSFVFLSVCHVCPMWPHTSILLLYVLLTQKRFPQKHNMLPSLRQTSPTGSRADTKTVAPPAVSLVFVGVCIDVHSISRINTDPALLTDTQAAELALYRVRPLQCRFGIR